MGKQLETCKNCEEKFQSTFRFCPHCGQQVKDQLTVKVLFYNTISNYFSFDARFLKSVLPLLLRPGYLASRFIEGKRLLYLHPAQMYLFIAVVFFFLFSFIQREQVETIDRNLSSALKPSKVEIDSILDKNIGKYMDEKSKDSLLKVTNSDAMDIEDWGFSSKKIDSLIKNYASEDTIYKAMGIGEDAGFFKRRMYAQGLKFYKSRKGGSILQTFYDTIPIAMFFLLPIFALILMLLYWRKGTYAHHLVFSFYYFSFLFVVFSLILGVNFIVDIPDGLDFLIMLSTFVYLVIALSKFYVQDKFISFIKASMVSISFLMIVAPITVVIIGIYAFMFF